MVNHLRLFLSLVDHEPMTRGRIIFIIATMFWKLIVWKLWGFSGGASGEEPTCQCRWHAIWARSLGREDPLEEGMATHSRILAWRIPWTEESSGLQSMGSQRVGHDWSDLARTHAHIHKIKLTILTVFKCASSVVLRIFTLLCNQAPELSSSCKIETLHHYTTSFHFPSPSLWQAPGYFLSLWMRLL